MATELDNLVVKIEADLSKLKNGLKNANRATQNASKSMSANFKNLGKRLDRIGLAALKVGTALGGVFAGYQIKRVIDVGRQVEDLGLRFNALFGSVEEGAKAFEVMKNFAAGVPFSFEEIQRASGNLAVVADDAEELAEVLAITGNVAATTGLDFTQTAEQIQRSFAGGISAADVFRERGVRNLLGFAAGAEVSASQTIKAFKRVFGQGGEFGDITEELARTLTGTISMLQDKLFAFRVAVAQTFNVEVKKQLSDLNSSLQEQQKQIEEFGRDVGQTLAATTVKIIDNLDQIKAAFIGLGVIIAGSVLGIVARNPIILALLGISAALENQNQVTKEAEARVKRFSKANKDNNFTLDKALEAIDKLAKPYGVFTDHIREAKKEVKKLDESLKIILVSEEKLKEITDSISKEFEDMGKSIADAFAESVVRAKNFGDAMRNIFLDVVQAIVSTITHILIVQPLIEKLTESLKKLNEQQSGGSTEDQIVRSLISAFTGGSGGGGFMASGGNVHANTPYVVGEKGAELFVPRQGGTIIPNNEMGNGVTINQNLNISTGVSNTVRAEIMTLMPKIKQETVNAVAESRSRGGNFSRVFGA